jgi:hypothetical protein
MEVLLARFRWPPLGILDGLELSEDWLVVCGCVLCLTAVGGPGEIGSGVSRSGKVRLWDLFRAEGDAAGS